MLRLSYLFVSLLNVMAPLVLRRRISEIGTNQVAELLETKDASMVLVDARSEAEVAVSMIPGAITQAEFWSRRDELCGKTIVAYCTVGGRSLLLAQRCAKAGFEVRNYRGSILDWCATGRSLVTSDGSTTTRLHTYSRIFTVPSGYQRA